MKKIREHFSKYDALFMFILGIIVFIIYDDLHLKERLLKVLEILFALFFWFYVFPYLLLKILSYKKKTKK